MLPPDPTKDPADHLGLAFDHLEARRAALAIAADITVTVGGSGQHTHDTGLGQMALAPAAALEHARPLIFREHALDLEEQVVFRGVAEGPV